jgi:hypothetical protein
MTAFVLVHSPAVGPATWAPVAERLRSAGQHVVVPTLLGVGEGEPPFWPRVVAAVAAALDGTEPAEPVTLVVHSNAGVFVPVLVRDLGRPVACCLFADATIPGQRDVTPMAEEEFLPFLRGLAGPDGRLPRWTDWWGEQAAASLLPDQQVRELITGEEPRLPLRYFSEQVPATGGWHDRPCGYLVFSQGYEEAAADAGRRGWPVRRVPGEHLHQVVDPGGVATALLELAAATAGSVGSPGSCAAPGS